jgi:zinc protease
MPAFRDYWQHRLAEGPVKVSVVGDVDRAAVIAAVARTLGTLAPRSDIRPDQAQRDVHATRPATTPVVLRHRGDAGQAMVARIWPTTGFLEDIPTARALELAASIIATRLTEQFRGAEGGSYAPFASHNDGGLVLDRYGLLLAGAQLRTDRIGDFDAALSAIVGDLAAHGPDADALARAKATAIAAMERGQSNNPYWSATLRADLDDPRQVDAIRGAVASRSAVTAQQVRAAVTRFMGPTARSFDIQVLLEPATAKTN